MAARVLSLANPARWPLAKPFGQSTGGPGHPPCGCGQAGDEDHLEQQLMRDLAGSAGPVFARVFGAVSLGSLVKESSRPACVLIALGHQSV